MIALGVVIAVGVYGVLFVCMGCLLRLTAVENEIRTESVLADQSRARIPRVATVVAYHREVELARLAAVNHASQSESKEP